MAVRPLNIIEVCSGNAGLERALRLAGVPVRTVCHIENEAYAAAVLVAQMEEGALAPAPNGWEEAAERAAQMAAQPEFR